MPTEYLPSTTAAESDPSVYHTAQSGGEDIEDPILVVDGDRRYNPRTSWAQRRSTPGFYPGQNRLRSAYADRRGQFSPQPVARADLICFKCYGRGHIRPGCEIDVIADASMVVQNWQKLSAEDQSHFSDENMKTAVKHLMLALPKMLESRGTDVTHRDQRRAVQELTPHGQTFNPPARPADVNSGTSASAAKKK